LSDPSANPADYQFGIAWLKDSTGSGTPDYQAIELDTSLLVYEFALVSGGGQTVAPNAVSAEPIIVKLLHQNAPAANVAVTLSTGGSPSTTGALGSSSTGPWLSELTLPTNTQGEVQVWWQAPNQPRQQISITATTLDSTTPLSIPAGTGSGGGGGGNPGTVGSTTIPPRNTREMIDTIVIETSSVSFYSEITVDYLSEAWWKEYNITAPSNVVFDFGSGTKWPALDPQPETVNTWPEFERRSFPLFGQLPSFDDVLRVKLFASSDHRRYDPKQTFLAGIDWNCQWTRFRIKSSVPLPEGFRLKYVGLEDDYTQIESTNPMVQFTPALRSGMSTNFELVIPPGGTTSNTITLMPRTQLDPETQLGEKVVQILLPMELAPEVLAVNTNFDEGDVDDETHYAKPDCENGTLKAARDHLDGKWQEGDIVTDDLHKGFFGLRPGTLPYTETAGAVVKIKKLDKNDPETNRKQSGHVRLYAVWGSEGNETEMKIELYDKDSLVANDIGPLLYHQNPNTPVEYYLEGVAPGKITLEFSYQKGSISFKHEQEFLVATHQTKDKWLKEIRYQLLLQTDGAVDLNHYLPNDGGWKPRPDPITGSRSFVFHAGRVRSIYDYYGQLYEQWPEKLDWMGAARLVGGAVYGGLCDLQASDPSISVKDKLMGGQILIYRDLGWQHRAYVASGIWALEWVDEHDSASINGIGGQGACEIEVWRDFDGNIANNSWLGVKEASRLLVRREQQEVIAPMWAEMANFAAGFVGSASNEAKNPVDPESPTFLEVVPNGSVANYADRDRFSFGWSHSPKGVFPVWWGETESSGNPTAFYAPSTRLGLVRIPLRTRAALFAQFGTIY